MTETVEIGTRSACRRTCPLARDHQADGLGRAGLGRHDVDRGGTGAAQILVRDVQQVLVWYTRGWSSACP